jgi:hypothetical protein
VAHYLKRSPRLLKLLTPRKKNYIQWPSEFKTALPLSDSRILAQVKSQQKGKLEMGGDILKGDERPTKKKSKKKAASKKAAKKTTAKKKR